ncbi:MAG TPA: hypothetical protein VFZ19_10775 [Solirubrobacterales bacterium]
MRISKRFELGRRQGELDFIDVDDVGDTRLYVDPRALRLLPTEWGHECVSLIQSFFRAVLREIKNENKTEAIRLLSGLTEPNETRLGLSKKEARGTALGPELAMATFESLARSEAAKSGLLKDLEDTALMVEGIGLDRVSDIATNIVRGPLIRYTQEAADLYGIPLKQGVASGNVWDPKLRTWTGGFTDLPVTKRGPLILVPKSIVRRRLDYDTDEYFTHYVLPYMQQVELDANSALVTLLKDGTPRVYKKTLRKHYGQGKSAAVQLTREHPEVLAWYRKDKKQRPQGPMDHLELAEELGVSPPDFKALLSAVQAIPSGKKHATDYHLAVEALLSALFYPSLAHPDVEHEIHEGRKRIDISYMNIAQQGFFQWVSDHYSAPYIYVECKNYRGDPANPELDQLAGRFSPSRGKVGLLVCRKFKEKDLFIKRCRDTALDDRGFILPLDDGDLADLVEARGAFEGEGAYRLLRLVFEKLI